ncbi:MAG TPA: hypothetical protein VM933_00770 [Acidimicrobiales bacterium]|nr:hypothetical protein [Acidimicrobiales bacterium]
MADVRVTPETFSLVAFDAGRIRELAAQLAEEVGLPADAVIEIAVDERTPAQRAKTVPGSGPIRFEVEGGAFEDPTVPRTLSDRLTVDVLGRLLFRVADRRSGGFADAPPDEELTLQQQTAWDSYCMGRLERLGHDVRKPRRQYHFRNRHGFSDVADRAFERLWAGEGLTWADVEAACAETAEARASVSA